MGYIAFDLDGTIAKYDGWVSDYHIGEPIEPMIRLIKDYLAKGIEVRIFTARVSENRGKANLSPQETIELIQDWTEKHIGVRLPVTCHKDFHMWKLYDDRAIQVVPNMGQLIEDVLEASNLRVIELSSELDELRQENDRLKIIIEEQNNNRLKLAQSC